MQRDASRRPASFLVRRKLEVLRGDNEKVPEIVLNDTARTLPSHVTPNDSIYTPAPSAARSGRVSRGISRVYGAHFRHAKLQSGLSGFVFFSFFTLRLYSRAWPSEETNLGWILWERVSAKKWLIEISIIMKLCIIVSQDMYLLIVI